MCCRGGYPGWKVWSTCTEHPPSTKLSRPALLFSTCQLASVSSHGLVILAGWIKRGGSLDDDAVSGEGFTHKRKSYLTFTCQRTKRKELIKVRTQRDSLHGLEVRQNIQQRLISCRSGCCPGWNVTTVLGCTQHWVSMSDRCIWCWLSRNFSYKVTLV